MDLTNMYWHRESFLKRILTLP